MNVAEWISFVVLFLSYGDAGDIPTNETAFVSDTEVISANGTVEISGSPCLTAKQYTTTGSQEHFEGFCYWHSNFSELRSGSAEFRCRSVSSNLVSIHSLQELNFLQRLLQGRTDYFWIGLHATGSPLSYQWSDGTPVDFVNWEDGYSGTRIGWMETCVLLNPSNGFFIPTDCYESHLYICKAKDESDVLVSVTSAPTSLSATPSNRPTVLPTVCPDEWRIFGDKCYGVFGAGVSTKETWPDANQKCVDLGATLVSIHNIDEQDFLFLIMVEKTDMSWIGFRELPNSADRAFHWSDGSPVDFTYWDSNQPNNWNNYKEECGNMRFDSPHLGRWNDAECHMKQSYICQIHIDPKKAKFAQDADICSAPKGWLKLDSSCYKIFTGTGNNMTWLEAQYFCREFRGNTVTVRSLKDSTFLRFHLADFKGEFWIGLRNEMGNATYKWTTGRVQFSNWDRGQPHEFSDQPNCVAMTTGGRWVVRSCSENHPFICEVDEEIPPPAPQEASEGMICPNISLKWKDYGTHFCYIIELKDRLPWFYAAHRCFQEGGFLASFHSIGEVDAILDQIKDYKNPLHIGLAQSQNGDFVWDDRSVVDFANWLSGHPSSNKNQMCVEMLSASGKWNDTSCEIQRGYICSVPKIFYNASMMTMTPTEKISDTGNTSAIGVGGILGIILFFVVSVLISIGAYHCLFPSKKSVRSPSQSELCDSDI